MPNVSPRPPTAPFVRPEIAVAPPAIGIAARFRAAPLAWRVFAIALVLQLPLIALYLVDAAAIHGKFLDINEEGNPFTWFRSIQFFVAAGACAIAWRGGRDRWIWGPVAIVMLFFSFDDIATLHERSEGIAGLKHAVMVLEAGIGLVVLAAAVGAIRRLPRRGAAPALAWRGGGSTERGALPARPGSRARPDPGGAVVRAAGRKQRPGGRGGARRGSDRSLADPRLAGRGGIRALSLRVLGRSRRDPRRRDQHAHVAALLERL